MFDIIMSVCVTACMITPSSKIYLLSSKQLSDYLFRNFLVHDFDFLLFSSYGTFICFRIVFVYNFHA